MTDRKGKMRVEVETPDGERHSAEESLSDSLIELLEEGRRRPTTEHRLQALDKILEKGGRLLLSVAGAVSRALGRS